MEWITQIEIDIDLHLYRPSQLKAAETTESVCPLSICVRMRQQIGLVYIDIDIEIYVYRLS